MALLAGQFRVRDGGEFAGVLRHHLPAFRYEDLGGGDQDSTLGVQRVVAETHREDRAIEGPTDRWQVYVPGEWLIGESLTALVAWATFATWEELRFEVPWQVAVPEGVVVAAGSHDAILGFDDTSPEGLLGNNEISGRRAIGPALRRNVFLLDASSFDRLLVELGSASRDGRWLLRVLARLGRFSLAGAAAPAFTDDELAAFAEREEMGRDEVEALLDAWPDLTTFDVEVDAPTHLVVAGTLDLVAVDDGPAATFDDLREVVVSAEGSVETLDDERDGVVWVPPVPWPDPTDDALPVGFALEPSLRVVLAGVRGPVVVRVRATDGRELHRSTLAADDPALAALELVVAIDRRPPLPAPADGGGTTDATRQLRGQVVRSGPGAVGGLTVLVQTRAEGTGVLPRVFAAAETTASGSFFTSFPAGEWEEVAVLVSAAPDSVVTLELDDNGRVMEDFVVLLLGDDDVSAEEGGGPARLPDQAELVRSGEYRQDLGGGCLNVTTPNRSLREYRYNAIVRTSDPDVASYTLRRGSDGRYVFQGGATRWERPPIDLRHPVQWQHAPQAGDHLTAYQSVSIATGHILWFKAVFKSDGYSLGDLVYSLPLAPGQKKQIVHYDMVNSLTASESQELAQREGVTATLFDDRTITDQLSGSISEDVSGSSNASTAGVSAGLGLGGSVGPIGGSLGVSGGFANSRSRASQQGARSIGQAFDEKLRQSLIQSSEAFRQLNASVVTQVREGQSYGVTAEVVANHNHCHSLTMMYFEVLRHFAITQELSEVQECVFVPLLMTEFTPANIAVWKDVLARTLLPMPSNTLGWPLRRFAGRHPLARAFDANDRVRTSWTRVDYPVNSYAEDPINSVTGAVNLRVRLPRPRTRADRVMSLPVITETVVSREVDTVATVAAAIFTGGLSLLGGPSTRSRTETVLARKDIGDRFLQLDANLQDVPPARAIRVTTFEPQTVTVDGETITVDFFGNATDQAQWQAYAELLGYAQGWQLLQAYFAGNLIAEWDTVFNRDIAPLLWDAIVESIAFEPIGAGSGLALDVTPTQPYQGGDRRMQLRVRGGAHPAREDLAAELRIRATSADARGLRGFTSVAVQDVSLTYATPHFTGPVFRGFVGDDLLDTTGVVLPIPLTSNDLRNPRREDEYLQQELIDHLNANLEHYNGVLWRGLDPNRRYMLLDGFSIETYERDGSLAGQRSLASVVANELVTIAGNALVFPVADGYRVSRSLLVEADEENSEEARTHSLLDRYRPLTPAEPYRLSAPTRGVYAEALLGECDACEDVKENSSQDWSRFGVDEPTAIAPVTTPTPQRTDWKAIWAQFASPIVAIQPGRDLPAPGAGLAGLSDALTEAGAFRDVTGLAANQDNVIRTYLSNQENAKAFAEMAKGMAMQEHNTSNSRSIMQTLDGARRSGAITEDDHRELVRQHLDHVVDGGQAQAREAEREAARDPSLEQAGIEAVQRGREVRARTRSADGSEQDLEVSATEEPTQGVLTPITYDVPLVAQPNKTACWAASMAMLESFRRSLDAQMSLVVSAEALAAEVGYSLDQSYGWDRLEDVRAEYDLEDIDGLSLAQYPSATQWAAWLRTYGPLYVTIDGAPTHAIIVHGISGDGTDTGTIVQVHNPWDTTATFDTDPVEFRPPNTGRTQTLTIEALNQQFNGGQLDELEFYSRWRVLYSTAVQTHLQSGTPAPSGQTVGVTCWPVASADLITEAVTVAEREWTAWSGGNWTETGTSGRDRVEEYWRSVAAAFPGVASAWSAVFISWLFTRAYTGLAPAGTTVGGADLADYDTLGAASHDAIMSRANRCLVNQGLFNTSANHFRYVVNTRALTGTTAVVRDPATTDVEVGDMVFAGRSGNTYQVVGDDLQRAVTATGAPQSHIDIVVAIEDFAAVPGVRVAVLIGGNTLPGANVVGRKYRPLQPGTDRIATAAAQPPEITAAITDGTLTHIGTGSYYSFAGASGHERVQIADVEALFRL
jgi:hypothetical protein